mmetsp:Transcript_10473/g.26040  ORF Transcript_10473/g.26040 Transcript_10473/m.26040 type:complete len:336 (+) Transcript_10473:27-1034(+)
MSVDYSKWNKMIVDDDDDDAPRRPRVTRLDGPSTITMGHDGGLDVRSAAAAVGAPVPHTTFSARSSAPAKRDGLDYGKWDSLQVEESDEEGSDEPEMSARPADSAEAEDELSAEELATLRRRLHTEAAATPTAPPDAPPAAPTRSARHEALVARLTRNGAARDGYLWRQTERDVEMSVVLPAGTKAKMLQVELLPADMSHPRQRLSVRWRQGGSEALFERPLAYPVEDTVEGEPAEKEELSWELCDFETDANERLLRVSMRKREVHGIVIWWSRAIEGEEELDTQTLPDRKSASKLSAQQDVWEQANRLFKEQVACREKIMLDPSPNDEEDQDVQ